MSDRLHDRTEFYKYASYETALRVIQSRSFRWSSPTLFNDPFDHQTGFVLDFDQDHFAELLTASTERLIFGDSVLKAEPCSLNARMILQMRSIRDRLPRDQFMNDMREGSIEVARSMPEKLAELNAQLQDVLCNSRVFCVSETPDNAVMWSHYANEHRGVVLKLRCDDELDNRLLAARKVDYQEKFLSFASAEEYAKHLTGEEPFDLIPLIWRIAYTKHRDWSYEREWRVHIPLLGQQKEEGHSLYPEDPKIFEGLYLGCRMATDAIELICEEAKKHLPNMRLYLSKRSSSAFALSFELLNGV
jgi:hypothetical protein